MVEIELPIVGSNLCLDQGRGPPAVCRMRADDFRGEKKLKVFDRNTSNGGCRREEKSRKHWSLLSLVTANLFIC